MMRSDPAFTMATNLISVISQALGGAVTTRANAACGTTDEGNFTVEFHRPHFSTLEIVVHDLAQAEREVSNDVRGRDDLAHWQCGNRRQRMRLELERRRA
jgi:hypothetical protein